MIIDNNDDEYSFHNDPREPDHDSEIDSRAFLQRWKNRREVHRRQWVLAVHWKNWEPLRRPLVRGDLWIQLQITIFNYINRSHYLHICNAYAVYYYFPRCGLLVEQSSRIPMFTKSSMTTTWHSSHHTSATGSHQIQIQIRIQFFWDWFWTFNPSGTSKISLPITLKSSQSSQTVWLRWVCHSGENNNVWVSFCRAGKMAV